MTKFIAYVGNDEVLVTTKKNEHDFLKEYFKEFEYTKDGLVIQITGKGDRDFYQYNREEVTGCGIRVGCNMWVDL